MKKTNRPNPSSTAQNGSRAHPAELTPAPRPSAQLIFEGVVASYIHDISKRHGHPRIASDRMGVSEAGGS